MRGRGEGCRALRDERQECKVGIDVRSPYITSALNNELQCNVGNMWEKLPCIYMH